MMNGVFPEGEPEDLVPPAPSESELLAHIVLGDMASLLEHYANIKGKYHAH